MTDADVVARLRYALQMCLPVIAVSSGEWHRSHPEPFADNCMVCVALSALAVHADELEALHNG